MSDANRVAFRYMKESTWGVVPTAALTNLRVTTAPLGQDQDTVGSQELRSDRATPRGSRTSISANASANFELSYGNLDGLVEGLCGATAWPSEIDETGIVHSMAIGDNSINRSSGSYVTDGFVPGQWVKISGFTLAANNGWFRLGTVAATKMTLEGGIVATEAAGDNVTITGTRLKGNGTNKISYVLEKEFSDIGEFIYGTGFRPGSLSLEMSVGSVITGSMGFLGKQVFAAGSTQGTGAHNAAPTNNVMNVVDNFRKVVDGGSPITGVRSISFNVNNNLRTQPELGVLGGNDIGLGSSTVTGSFERYFKSRALYEKYLNRTESDFGFVVDDAAGNGYAFSVPALDFTNAEVAEEGLNGDVLANFEWAGHHHAASDEMWSITRVAA